LKRAAAPGGGISCRFYGSYNHGGAESSKAPDQNQLLKLVLFFFFGTMSAGKIFMNSSPYYALFWASCILSTAFLFVGHAAAASDEARVTRIIHEVKLLPYKSDPKPAALNDRVNESTAVRTGNESRSELTFVDLTISRLGSNSIFSFNKAGRSVDLGGGSLLLRVPKDSGGARISTSAVTVGVTGTTVILESSRGNKLIVLEGSARISLRRFPMESASVRGGQMINVPPGATTLPPVTNINVDDVMKKHPLITDFPPLPSRDLIYAGNNSPPVQGQPVGGGSGGGVSVGLPLVGNLVGPIPLRPTIGRGKTKPSRTDGGGDGYGSGASTNDGVATRSEESKRKKKKGGTNDGYPSQVSTSDGVATGSQGSNNKSTGGTGAQALSRGKPSPAPTPSRRRKSPPRRHGG
jgi:FecR protein